MKVWKLSKSSPISSLSLSLYKFKAERIYMKCIKRELFESFLIFIVNFEIEFKIDEWPKNSKNLDLRSFFGVLLENPRILFQANGLSQ
jgi:hypothetical protein